MFFETSDKKFGDVELMRMFYKNKYIVTVATWRAAAEWGAIVILFSAI